MTALHWAATLGHPDLVQILLAAGAMVDCASSWAGTPLSAAAAGRHGAEMWLATTFAGMPADAKRIYPVVGSDEDYVAALRALLAAKANVNAREPGFDRTPILTAVSQGHAAAVEVLLAAGADLQLVDRYDYTTLHVASEMEAPPPVVSNIVTRLLRAGASPTPFLIRLTKKSMAKKTLEQCFIQRGWKWQTFTPHLCG